MQLSHLLDYPYTGKLDFMSNTTPKEIGRIHVNLQELHELQADIARIFADLEGPEAKRTMQLIMNKLEYCKSAVRAQNWLARIGAIKIIDERK